MAEVNAPLQQQDLLHERNDVEAVTRNVTSLIRDIEEYLSSDGDDRDSARVLLEEARGYLVSLEEPHHGETSTVPSMWQACWLRIKEIVQMIIWLLLEGTSLLRSSISEHEVEHESGEEHGQQESGDEPVHGQSREELVQQESRDEHGQRKSDQVQYEASALGVAKGKGNVCSTNGPDGNAFLLFSTDMSYKMRSEFHIEMNKTIEGLWKNMSTEEKTMRRDSAVAVTEMKDLSNFMDPEHRAEFEKELENMKKEISTDHWSGKRIQEPRETEKGRVSAQKTGTQTRGETSKCDASKDWRRDKEVNNRADQERAGSQLAKRNNAPSSGDSASHGGESSHREPVVASSAGQLVKPPTKSANLVTHPNTLFASPSAGVVVPTSHAAAGKSSLSQSGGTDIGAEAPSSKASEQGGDPSKSQSEASGSSTSPNPKDDGFTKFVG